MPIDYTLTVPPHIQIAPVAASKLPGLLEDPLYIRAWHAYVRFCTPQKEDLAPKKIAVAVVGLPLYLSEAIPSLLMRLGLMKRTEQVDLVVGVAYRTKIMQETLERLKEGRYTSPDGTQHSLDLRPAANGVKIVLSGGAVRQRPGSKAMNITVKNQDCLLCGGGFARPRA